MEAPFDRAPQGLNHFNSLRTATLGVLIRISR